MVAANDAGRGLRRSGTAAPAAALPAAAGARHPNFPLYSAQGRRQSPLARQQQQQQQSPLNAGAATPLSSLGAADHASRLAAAATGRAQTETRAVPSPFPLFDSLHATPPPPPALRPLELPARRSFFHGASPATPSSAASLAARPPRTPEGGAPPPPEGGAPPPPSSSTCASRASALQRSATLTTCVLTPIAADGALRRSSCAAPRLLAPGSGGSTVAAAVAPLFAQHGVGGARMSSGPSGPPAATSHAAFASGPSLATPPAAPRSRGDSRLSGARRSASVVRADPIAPGFGEVLDGGSRASRASSDVALELDGWPGQPPPAGELSLPPPPSRRPPAAAALSDADFDSLDLWHSPGARGGGGSRSSGRASRHRSIGSRRPSQ